MSLVTTLIVIVVVWLALAFWSLVAFFWWVDWYNARSVRRRRERRLNRDDHPTARRYDKDG